MVHNRKFLKVLVFIFSVTFWCCKSKDRGQENTLFTSVPANSSGIDFVNKITTSDSVNILDYEYLYNGEGVGIGYFNNDSLPDIFFTGNMVPCKLYLNKGNFQFEDITVSSGIDTRNVWAYGVCIVDINQDGWQDIYLSAGGIGNKDAFPNQLYINQGDLTFKEQGEEYGLNDPGESIQAVFFDYDKDSDLDMYLLTGGGFERSAIVPRPIMKDGSNRNGAAYADLDMDGDLDLVVNNIDAVASIHRNMLIERAAPQSNYLRIKLTGPLNNKSGIGTKVMLKYNDKVQMRFKSVVCGFESTVEDILHTGLGDIVKVDTIEVVWPDGKISNLYNVSSNRLIEIDYASAKRNIHS